MSGTSGLRVRVHATDPLRRRGLAVLLEAAGHVLTDETPDVELCDRNQGSGPLPKEAEAPVVALSASPITGAVAGVLAPNATGPQLDAALRAVYAGLLVRSVSMPDVRGFAPADDMPLLTPREREILGLIGEGLSNKAMARRLGISVHTGQVPHGGTFHQAGCDQPRRSGNKRPAWRSDRALGSAGIIVQAGPADRNGQGGGLAE